VNKISFENTYEELGEEFHFKNSPFPVSNPKLIIFNQELAKDLGIDSKFSNDDAKSYFSGNKVLTGSQPLAMAYSGQSVRIFFSSAWRWSGGLTWRFSNTIRKSKRPTIKRVGTNLFFKRWRWTIRTRAGFARIFSQ